MDCNQTLQPFTRRPSPSQPAAMTCWAGSVEYTSSSGNAFYLTGHAGFTGPTRPHELHDTYQESIFPVRSTSWSGNRYVGVVQRLRYQTDLCSKKHDLSCRLVADQKLPFTAFIAKLTRYRPSPFNVALLTCQAVIGTKHGVLLSCQVTEQPFQFFSCPNTTRITFSMRGILQYNTMLAFW